MERWWNCGWTMYVTEQLILLMKCRVVRCGCESDGWLRIAVLNGTFDVCPYHCLVADDEHGATVEACCTGEAVHHLVFEQGMALQLCMYSTLYKIYSL